MPPRNKQLAMISLAVLLATGLPSAQAWQVPEYPAVQSLPGYPQPVSPLAVHPYAAHPNVAHPFANHPYGAHPDPEMSFTVPPYPEMPAPGTPWPQQVAFVQPEPPANVEPIPEPVTVFDEAAARTMWPNFDTQKILTDTSLIAWWNRAYVEETAAGVPPGRSIWTPSAITGQLVWLNRSMPNSTVLLTGGVFDGITTVHSPVVTTNDLVMPVEAGVRMSVPLGRPGIFQPELVYLGVFDQNASVSYAPAATLGVTETIAPLFDQAIANAATNITVSYESDLHSAECNFWYDSDGSIQGLVGFRWMQQSEEFEQFESQNWANGNFAELTNNLYGGQLGFRAFILERGKLSIFAIGKGGVFYNDVVLSANSQSGGVTINSLSQSGSTTAWVGELNVTAVWQFNPYFSFHAGYTGLWLAQVGLVGDQLDRFSFATGSGSFDYDGISYQGGHLGVTFAW